MNEDALPESPPSVLNLWNTAGESGSHGTERDRPQRLSPLPLLRITDGMPCREAATFLGINAGTLQKWRNGETETGLHYARADRIAIKNLGKHPADIWGQDWWKV